MKRYLLLLSAAFALNAHAQTDSAKKERGFQPDKMVWGGSLALSFSQLGSSFGVSPIIGYKISDRFVPGVGFSYYHNRLSDVYGNSWTMDVYGGNIWGKFFLLPRLYLAGEAEGLNSNWDHQRPDHRYFLDSYLGGAGYCERYGNFSNYIEFLYVFNQLDAAYDSPIVIKAGFAFGL